MIAIASILFINHLFFIEDAQRFHRQLFYLNSNIFYLLVKQGENVIKRESTECKHMIDEWLSGHEVYQKAFKAYSGDGEFYIDNKYLFSGFPRRLMIPKGKLIKLNSL